MGSVGETRGRAQRIQSSIQAGMNVDQVIASLSGRYIVSHCSVVNDGKLRTASKEEFVGEMRKGGSSGVMKILLLGSTPFRAYFTVTFDSLGTVCEKSTVKGWWG
jgi:hypothetical protein